MVRGVRVGRGEAVCASAVGSVRVVSDVRVVRGVRVVRDVRVVRGVRVASVERSCGPAKHNASS